MKLITKLTISSILLIGIAVSVCCFLILSFTRNRTMEGVIITALSDVNGFMSDFTDKMEELELPQGELILRSYAINQHRRITRSNEYTLFHEGEYLCNNTGFDAEALLKNDHTKIDDTGIRYRTVRIEGESYLIAGSKATLGANEYGITLVRDMSAIENTIQSLGIQCILVSLAIIAIAAIFMWSIVYHSIKPVEELKRGANELAGGHYDKRIAIRGKDELSELAGDFNQMAEAIETNIGKLNEKSERQRAFINDLSHEMKTPITAILLSGETLLNRKVSQEAMINSLTRIYDQGKWLEQLSQKLMTLTILQGEIALKPESVSKLLEAVRETTADALNEQNMKLIIDCSIDTLPMDIDLLRSALVNLVENGRKASMDGQTIEIHAYGNIIEVTDHGSGIPPEEITRVTEPFYMVDRSRNKRLGGAGLGLALVNRIAQAHGAVFTIDSVLGHWTTARLMFQSRK